MLEQCNSLIPWLIHLPGLVQQPGFHGNSFHLVVPTKRCQVHLRPPLNVLYLQGESGTNQFGFWQFPNFLVASQAIYPASRLSATESFWHVAPIAQLLSCAFAFCSQMLEQHFFLKIVLLKLHVHNHLIRALHEIFLLRLQICEHLIPIFCDLRSNLLHPILHFLLMSNF